MGSRHAGLSSTAEYGPLIATMVAILPVMAAYLLFQKSFVRGLLGGAGK